MNHKREKFWLRAYRVFRFYAVDWRSFLACLRDPNLKFHFGKYELFNGHKLPYFFRSQSILLADIEIGERRIEETIQYRRVREVLKFYPDLPPREEVEGRDSRRIYDLVCARLTGQDNFVILLQRIGPRRFQKIDGGTRLAVLAATGAETVEAVFTLRGDSRF